MTGESSPILLVEDTESLSALYTAVLSKAGYSVECALRAEEARAAHQNASGRLVLLDLVLPDGDGIELLSEMRAADPSGKVIVITANGSINKAVDAMRGGAFDFLVKPFDERRLLSAVGNALEAIGSAASPLLGETGPVDSFHGFIGASDEMRKVYQLIRDIGPSTASVFITGESGTGKEIAAQAIHAESSRASGPFIPLNCGAIPRDLLETEVFGHLKGSFTGAIAEKQGAASAADGGTLFFDEICEMDLSLQTKLLRFLQTSTVTPVGATVPRRVDARIICATNRDPVAEVRAGRFREDLYYRLHVVPLHLAPLRERGDDVLRVAEAMLHRFSEREGKGFTRFSPDVETMLRSFDWPGNVRQLQNVIWNAVLLHDGETIEIDMLPVWPNAPVRESAAHSVVTEATREDGVNGSDLSSRVKSLVGTTLAEVERELIEATIIAHDGSVPKAARILDLSPSTIYRKREAWGKSGS